MPESVQERSAPDRLKWLRAQHGAALLEAFMADPRNQPFSDLIRDGDGRPLGTSQAEDAVFAAYRASDPTRTGACTQWLIRLAIAGNLPAEDLPKARETLEAFGAYKRRLPADQRDLGRHETLGAVWKAVEPFVLENAPTSGKDEDRREREAARAESDILLEADGWTVAIPRTERAACWWGRGTRWCTASEHHNMFSYYSQQAPLVVFVRPDGEKFQFHAGCENVHDEVDLNDFDEDGYGGGKRAQFMDSADNPTWIDEALPDVLGVLKDRLPALHATMAFCYGGKWRNRPPSSEFSDAAVLRDAHSVFGMPFHRLPPKERTPACWDVAFRRSLAVLAEMPPGIRTTEMLKVVLHHAPDIVNSMHFAVGERDLCLEAVRHSGLHLKRVPAQARDRELCLAAVTKNGMALEYVPSNMRDAEMCLAAVHSAGRSLKHVPRGLVDRAMCQAAIENTPCALPLAPAKLIDEELCFLAVSHRAREIHLRDIPPAFLSDRVCRAYAENNSNGLGAIPLAKRTRDVCLAAVSKHEIALRWVPPSMLDRAFYQDAVSRHGNLLGQMLGRVPEEMIDREMCLAAVTSNAQALDFVPPQFRDDEICEIAIDKNPYILKIVPKRVMQSLGRQFCAGAVRRAPEMIRFLPIDMIDREMCEVAIEARWTSLENIPTQCVDEDLCLKAIRIDPLAVQYVPDLLRKEEFYIQAVQISPQVLGKMHARRITGPVYAQAVRTWGWDTVGKVPVDDKAKLETAAKAILLDEQQAAARLTDQSPAGVLQAAENDREAAELPVPA